jgi:hypothetical protein
MVSLRILQSGRVLFREKYSNEIARRAIQMLSAAGSKDETYRNVTENVDRLRNK